MKMLTKEELNQLNESIKHCDEVIENLKLKGNCDECLKQHEQLKKWLIEYKNLINEHFDENGNARVIANIIIYEDKMKEIVDEAIKKIFNPEPYKFEELEKGMLVWDDKEKLCNLIYETRINCAGEQEIEFQFTIINLDGDEFLCDIFEEGRFYPVTKALEYQK